MLAKCNDPRPFTIGPERETIVVGVFEEEKVDFHIGAKARLFFKRVKTDLEKKLPIKILKQPGLSFYFLKFGFLLLQLEAICY
jgi:hypothetical protein